MVTWCMEDLKEKFVNLWPVEANTECCSPAADRACSEDRSDGVLQLEGALSALEVVSCDDGITYEMYESELQMPDIMKLMKTALSEPYSIYTYRYFIHNWPQLCILAKSGTVCVGAIVCKLEMHHFNTSRGYIAMLAVDEEYRKKKIGSTLVKKTIQQMVNDGCDEVVLETEVTNRAALCLYENLGFVRDKYLHQYYLNGVDAYRLKLWLKEPPDSSYTS